VHCSGKTTAYSASSRLMTCYYFLILDIFLWHLLLFISCYWTAKEPVEISGVKVMRIPDVSLSKLDRCVP